jgi:hypothetical protein
MSKAIFLFTFLMKASKFGKWEIGFTIVLFLSFWGMALSRSDMHIALDGFLSTPMLIFYAYVFTQDSAFNRHSLDDGEYFALLFTRPLTRASYILTKAVVAACGIIYFVIYLLILFFLGQLLGGAKTFVFPDAWQALNLLVNAFGFGCLVVMIRALPTRVGGWVLIVFWYASAVGTVADRGTKITSLDPSATYAWESCCFLCKQILSPAIDLEAVFMNASFSWTPVVSFLSNCFIYLLIATIIICRREFSYAQD